MTPLTMPYIGNAALIDLHKVGFLAPSHISSMSIVPTLKWATDMSHREDVAVVSGFSSHMEENVLRVLLRGKCGVILLLSRRQYKLLPDVWQQLLADNRLLILSVCNLPRQSRQSAYERNCKVCELADCLVMPCVPPRESSLYAIYEMQKRKKRLMFSCDYR